MKRLRSIGTVSALDPSGSVHVLRQITDLLRQIQSDLSQVITDYNREVYTVLSTLPQGVEDTRWNLTNDINPRVNDLDGDNIFVDTDASSTSDGGKYWNTSSSRPETIKGSLSNLYTEILDQTDQLRSEMSTTIGGTDVASSVEVQTNQNRILQLGRDLYDADSVAWSDDGSPQLTNASIRDMISGLLTIHNSSWNSATSPTPDHSGLPGSIATVSVLRITEGETDQTVVLKGYHSEGDGGGGNLYWDSTSTEADNDGTIFQVTGVTTGRWKRIYAGQVDVKWFGAYGDGVNDDTEAIRSARILVQSTGETLFFPVGTFMIQGGSGALNWSTSKNFRVIGSGIDTVHNNGTKLQASSSGPIFEVSGGWTYGIEIGYLSIWGYGRTDPNVTHGLWFHDNGPYAGSSHNFFHDIRISDFSGDGLHFDDVWHTLFQNIAVGNCGQYNFYVPGGNSTTLIRCYAEDVQAGYAGFRCRAGYPIFIGCNGIGNGWGDTRLHQADWGVFGTATYPAWAQNTAYTLGTIVNNNGHEYECLTPGTSSLAGSGPDAIQADITDGTCLWRHIGPADTTTTGCRPTLIGCNIEAPTRTGIRCKRNSSINLMGCSFQITLAGNPPNVVIPVWMEWSGGPSGMIDAAVNFNNINPANVDQGCPWHISLLGALPMLCWGLLDAGDVYIRTTGNQVKVKGVSSGFLAAANAATGLKLPYSRVEQGFATKRIYPTYGANVTIDTELGNQFVVIATDTNAFQIDSPAVRMYGQRLSITIRNESGGVLGAITWGGNFRLAGGSFTAPANGYQRTIEFETDNSNYSQEVSRTSADVQSP